MSSPQVSSQDLQYNRVTMKPHHNTEDLQCNKITTRNHHNTKICPRKMITKIKIMEEIEVTIRVMILKAAEVMEIRVIRMKKIKVMEVKVIGTMVEITKIMEFTSKYFNEEINTI
ncbi:uncharacterized protein O3C94_017226 isoform 3-T3 [Discoglossus pictus]